jgi:hypothetical protein
MKKSLNYLFIVFLFVYALFIGWHTREITWTILTVTLFGSGITLAFFAHARKNYLTILILLVHMGIEWFEWSHQKLSLVQGLFNLAHAGMDSTFLSHELRVHIGRHSKLILLGMLILLALIFVCGPSVTIQQESLEKLEPFVLGGVLGCVLSHIYFHLTKE